MAERGVTDPSSRRPLGSTGFSVSPVCVGAAPLGDMPATFEYSVSEQRAFDTLRAVFGSPLNFLDTAASYGDGESERRIGEALREIGGLPRVACSPPRRTATRRPETSQETRCAARSSGACGCWGWTGCSSCTCTTPSTSTSPDASRSST